MASLVVLSQSGSIFAVTSAVPDAPKYLLLGLPASQGSLVSTEVFHPSFLALAKVALGAGPELRTSHTTSHMIMQQGPGVPVENI